MSTGTVGRAQPEAAMPSAVDRHLRADAQRNRERILEAATTLMATQGIDVSIDAIAELAQVGVGTLYRNFPTKGALFQALLMARITPLVEQARAAADADDAGDAFVTFVRRCATSSPTFERLRMRWRRQVSISASPSRRSRVSCIEAVSMLLDVPRMPAGSGRM